MHWADKQKLISVSSTFLGLGFLGLTGYEAYKAIEAAKAGESVVGDAALAAVFFIAAVAFLVATHKWNKEDYEKGNQEKEDPGYTSTPTVTPSSSS